MRQVEVYRCWDDGTWDTGMVDIPDDTPEEDIERVAKDRTIELMADSPDLLCICGAAPFGPTKDTRITLVWVDRIKDYIPQAILRGLLQAEAPHFLRTLLEVALPPTDRSRFCLPIIETDHKRGPRLKIYGWRRGTLVSLSSTANNREKPL